MLGIQNVYTGSYRKVDGTLITGPSLSDLVAAKLPVLDNQMQLALSSTLQAMQVLVDSAQAGEAYDQLIGEGNKEGNAKVRAAVNALVAQTKVIEKIMPEMGLGGSNVQ